MALLENSEIDGFSHPRWWMVRSRVTGKYASHQLGGVVSVLSYYDQIDAETAAMLFATAEPKLMWEAVPAPSMPPLDQRPEGHFQRPTLIGKAYSIDRIDNGERVRATFTISEGTPAETLEEIATGFEIAMSTIHQTHDCSEALEIRLGREKPLSKPEAA